MRYRALLVDPANAGERPVQTLCNDPKEVLNWAKAYLKGASPDACVEVFECVESHVGRISIEDDKVKAVAFDCPIHGGEHAAFV